MMNDHIITDSCSRNGGNGNGNCNGNGRLGTFTPRNNIILMNNDNRIMEEEEIILTRTMITSTVM